MFESIRLDHTFANEDHFHIDVEVKWLRGTRLHPNVRFKFFRNKNGVGLEFRKIPGWPLMFENWPGEYSDTFGPYFIVTSQETEEDALLEIDADGIALINDITSNLPALIKQLVDTLDPTISNPSALLSEAESFAKFMKGRLLSLRIPAPRKSSLPALSDASPSHSNNLAPVEIRNLIQSINPDHSSEPPATAEQAMPDYVAEVVQEFKTVSFTTIKLSLRPLPEEGSPIIICVVKNEIDRLADFLRHYRAAGTERFVFIDNGSTDGTLELLARQADVDLYARLGRFDWKLKQGWIQKIVSMYGYERWYGYFDADEHVVFDELGNRTISDLIGLMESCGITRIRGLLVDMYSDGPLLESKYARSSRLKNAYPYFDTDSYQEAKYKEIISVKGGPRTRAFGAVNQQFRPEMTKYPLFKLDQNEYMANPHHIWPYSKNFISPRYLGILHYKFLPGVINKIKRAIAEENYWGGSLEYKCYLTVIEKNPEISLAYSLSKRYLGPSDLISSGIIKAIPWPHSVSSFERLRSFYLSRRSELQGATST